MRFSNGQEALSIDYSGAKYVRSALKIAAALKALFLVVENGGFADRLRNGHLEKSVVAGGLCPSRLPKTAKTPLKVHLRLQFQNLGKPRTAGLCGRAARMSDCGPLSCTKIERPSPRKNHPAKFDFSPIDAPTNIAKKLPPQRCFKPLLIPIFNFPHKRPMFAFTSESGYTLGFRRKIAHKGTHGETGGVLGGGWYHYPRSVPHVSETLRGQGVERQTLPLLGLGRGCSRRTQKAFGTAMRLCVSLSRRRRGPAGLRDPCSHVDCSAGRLCCKLSSAVVR